MTNTFARALVLLLLAVSLTLAESSYQVVARHPIAGNGGFDYITLDAASHRLYLSHGTQVEVVDLKTLKPIGVITDTPGVHGVAIAMGHGFTTNGAEHKVSMFDPATLNLVKKIDVGRGPDGIYYHPGSKRIFTNNHGSHDVTAIDAVTGNVVGTVKIGGDGEQAVIAKDGMIFVNSEDTNEVVKFNPNTLEVVDRYPIGVAEVPTGLAYDAKTQRLFVSCRRTPKLVVMDATNGKVIASFPIGTGADWAEFDATSKQVFVSTGEGLLNVFRQKSADVYEDAGAVKTQQSAKTMAFDAKTKKIYLTAAEYEMVPAKEPGKPARRTIKPGTFVLLVAEKGR